VKEKPPAPHDQRLIDLASGLEAQLHGELQDARIVRALDLPECGRTQGCRERRLWRVKSRVRSNEVGVWSFYIILCGGSADKLFFRDFDLEFFQEFWVFGHFLT
jgi:hypothetical protein